MSASWTTRSAPRWASWAVASPTLAVTWNSPVGSSNGTSNASITRSRDRHRLVVGLEQLEQDRELVAAEPGDDVAGADRRAQPHGDLDEQAVAGVVADAVVDLLEAVEVDEQHAEMLPGARMALERVLELVDEDLAVGQPGERVAPDAVLEADPLGDVLRRGVPALAVRAAAPQQPAPAPVVVAVAGEQLDEALLPAGRAGGAADGRGGVVRDGGCQAATGRSAPAAGSRGPVHEAPLTATKRAWLSRIASRQPA